MVSALYDTEVMMCLLMGMGIPLLRPEKGISGRFFYVKKGLEDPEFDPSVPAVYYLRVLEIPTPRWSTILTVKAGAPIPDNAPAIIQERGWSSPIWYYPRG